MTKTINDAPEQEWVDAEWLAAKTGIPASTWRDFGRRGIGPGKSLKVGRRRLWKWIEVEQWLDDQRGA